MENCDLEKMIEIQTEMGQSKIFPLLYSLIHIRSSMSVGIILTNFIALPNLDCIFIESIRAISSVKWMKDDFFSRVLTMFVTCSWIILLPYDACRIQESCNIIEWSWRFHSGPHLSDSFCVWVCVFLLSCFFLIFCEWWFASLEFIVHKLQRTNFSHNCWKNGGKLKLFRIDGNLWVWIFKQAWSSWHSDKLIIEN